MVILAGAGLGAAFLSAYMLAARQSEPAVQEAVVVTLPQRIQPPVPQPAARPPAERAQPSVGPGPMSDPAALARMLQRELKRVGCYDGEVSGVWSPASRAAMKASPSGSMRRCRSIAPIPCCWRSCRGIRVARVATLPGRGGAHRQWPLPAGRLHGQGRRQAGSGASGRSRMKVEPSKAVPVPLPVPVPMPARKPPPPPAVSAEPAPARYRAWPSLRPGRRPLRPLPSPRRSSRWTRPTRKRRTRRGGPCHAGPGPAMRVYGRSIRRFVRRAPSKPAAVARSLLRSLERAAQGRGEPLHRSGTRLYRATARQLDAAGVRNLQPRSRPDGTVARSCMR